MKWSDDEAVRSPQATLCLYRTLSTMLVIGFISKAIDRHAEISMMMAIWTFWLPQTSGWTQNLQFTSQSYFVICKHCYWDLQTLTIRLYTKEIWACLFWSLVLYHILWKSWKSSYIMQYGSDIILLAVIHCVWKACFNNMTFYTGHP